MSGSTQICGEVSCKIPLGAGNWFALTTAYRHERFVAQEIAYRGVETFLPTITEVHRWSDRKKKVEVPLFPGYVFVRTHMSADVRRKVTFARGAVAFVAMGGQPVPIPDDQIAALQQLLAQKIPFFPHAFLRIGQRVRIRGGSLDGLVGILSRFEGSDRLVVSVDGIQRSLAIHVAGYEIEPASSD